MEQIKEIEEEIRDVEKLLKEETVWAERAQRDVEKTKVRWAELIIQLNTLKAQQDESVLKAAANF